jgi:hypothetical protein
MRAEQIVGAGLVAATLVVAVAAGFTPARPGLLYTKPSPR